MSIDEIDAITHLRIAESRRSLDSHIVNRRGSNTNIWLGLGRDGLETVRISSVDGWRFMATSSTPLRNLCTGEVKFFVKVHSDLSLANATIFVDGIELDALDWHGPFVLLAAGEHEVRIEQPGAEPATHILHVSLEDRGSHEINLFADEAE